MFHYDEAKYYGFGLRLGVANLFRNGLRLGAKKTLGKILQPNMTSWEHAWKRICAEARNYGKLRSIVDIRLCVPSDSTPRIQEGHTLTIHILSGIVENALTVVGEPRQPRSVALR